MAGCGVYFLLWGWSFRWAGSHEINPIHRRDNLILAHHAPAPFYSQTVQKLGGYYFLIMLLWVLIQLCIGPSIHTMRRKCIWSLSLIPPSQYTLRSFGLPAHEVDKPTGLSASRQTLLCAKVLLTTVNWLFWKKTLYLFLCFHTMSRS